MVINSSIPTTYIGIYNIFRVLMILTSYYHNEVPYLCTPNPGYFGRYLYHTFTPLPQNIQKYLDILESSTLHIS